jgi:glycosyltransferase involved in cell wall biosynthesis
VRVLYVSATGGGGMGRAAQRYFPLEAARQGIDVAMVGEATAPELAGTIRTYALGRAWRSLGRRVAGLRGVVREFCPEIVHVFRHIDCELYPLACGAGSHACWIVDARTPILATGVSRLPSLLSGRVSGLVYDSRAAHAAAVGRYLFGRRDVTVLPPGYDDTCFAPRAEADAPGHGETLRLVYIGSLEERRQLVGALTSVVEAVSDPLPGTRRRITIDVYGEGAEDISIRALAARKPGVIRHAGFLPQGKLGPRLRDYDVGLSLIVNPVYREAPPLKTLEYLACGLPVIASDTPGNRLYVEEGVNGWLIGSRPEDIRANLHRLLREGVPSGMSERAAASVRGQSWRTIVADRVLPFYESCLAVAPDRRAVLAGRQGR